MTAHTCLPGHPGVLADGCPRCAENAAAPMLLDDETTAALWDRMVYAEYDAGDCCYETGAESKAATTFYDLALWLERHLGVDPFRTLDALRRNVRQPALGLRDTQEVHERIGVAIENLQSARSLVAVQVSDLLDLGEKPTTEGDDDEVQGCT